VPYWSDVLIIGAGAAGAAVDVPTWGSGTVQVDQFLRRQTNGPTFCCPAISHTEST
jgi:hypothetical protein